MNQARSGVCANRRGIVKDFFTAATLPALNSALVIRGIDPHAIIAIEMHEQTTASAMLPQFRVLYEVH